MATVTTDPKTIADRVSKWSRGKLKVEIDHEQHTVIASAKSIDVDADDLEALGKILGDQWKITLGRSGPNFRMIIW